MPVGVVGVAGADDAGSPVRWSEMRVRRGGLRHDGPGSRLSTVDGVSECAKMNWEASWPGSGVIFGGGEGGGGCGGEGSDV